MMAKLLLEADTWYHPMLGGDYDLPECSLGDLGDTGLPGTSAAPCEREVCGYLLEGLCILLNRGFRHHHCRNHGQQQEQPSNFTTGAWVNVHELVPEDTEWIIEITDSRRRDLDGGMPSFSPAQEALLRTHEQILESDNFGGDYGEGGRVVTCVASLYFFVRRACHNRSSGGKVYPAAIESIIQESFSKSAPTAQPYKNFVVFSFLGDTTTRNIKDNYSTMFMNQCFNFFLRHLEHPVSRNPMPSNRNGVA